MMEMGCRDLYVEVRVIKRLGKRRTRVTARLACHEIAQCGQGRCNHGILGTLRVCCS